MRPNQARAVLSGFLAVAFGVGGNLLYGQGAAPDSARAKAERAQQRMVAERLRRLSLDSGQTEAAAPGRPRVQPAPPPQAGRAPDPDASRGQAGAVPGGRIARFAPLAGRLDAPPPEAGGDAQSQDTIRAVQRELAMQGYEPGAVDGAIGLLTRAAILAFEHDHGLPLSGEPSEAVLKALRQRSAAITTRRPDTARPVGTAQAEQVIRTVQQSLAALGYLATKPDGRLGEASERAIRQFEADEGLVPTGRVSSQLIARLQKAQAQAASRSAQSR